MSSHANHEQELIDLVVTAVDLRAEFDQSQLAQCHDCRQIVEEHLMLVTDLANLHRAEAADLEAATQLQVESGRAEQALRELIQGESKGASSQSWRFLAVAAALLLALFAGWRLFPGETSPPHEAQFMGDSEVLRHPLGTVDTFAPFEWEVKAPPGGHFVIEILNDTEDAAGESIHRSDWLQGNQWTPPGDLKLPEAIQWNLEVYQATNSSESSDTYSAWAKLGKVNQDS